MVSTNKKSRLLQAYIKFQFRVILPTHFCINRISNDIVKQIEGEKQDPPPFYASTLSHTTNRLMTDGMAREENNARNIERDKN